jgi:hypothetical protein
MFWDNLSVPSRINQSKNCLTFEGGTDSVSQNVGKETTNLCCVTFWKSKVSFTPQQKPEVMQGAGVRETCLVS